MQIEIVLLARDRPEFMIPCIESILNAKTPYVKFKISDNSESDQIGIIVKRKFPDGYLYLRRNPTLSPFEHFKAVIRESTSEYLMIFHDDDIIDRDFFREIHKVITTHDKFSAISTNGIVFDSESRKKKSLIDPKFFNNNSVKFISTNHIIDAYFSVNSYGFPAFPSYIYKTKILKENMPSFDYGGKYTDLLILLRLSKVEPLLWVNLNLFNYRRHEAADSASENILHRIKLKRYLLTNKYISRKQLVFFTYSYWLFWFLRNKGNLLQEKSYRTRIIFDFLIRNTARFFLTSPSFRRKTVLWLKNKFM